jgi:hypothetical protein
MKSKKELLKQMAEEVIELCDGPANLAEACEEYARCGDGDVKASELYKEAQLQLSKRKPALKIIGEDGNAFAILGKASRVAKENGMDWDKIHKQATSGDYNHLLMIMMKYFNIE